jgi:hypothetical protein
MKVFLLSIISVLFLCCASNPVLEQTPKVINFKVESDIPVAVSIYVEKDCTDNWNFCDYQ